MRGHNTGYGVVRSVYHTQAPVTNLIYKILVIILIKRENNPVILLYSARSLWFNTFRTLNKKMMYSKLRLSGPR